MDFIVDSSVVAKWVLNEPGGEKARELIASHIFLRAPDLIISELANMVISSSRELFDGQIGRAHV